MSSYSFDISETALLAHLTTTRRALSNCSEELVSSIDWSVEALKCSHDTDSSFHKPPYFFPASPAYQPASSIDPIVSLLASQTEEPDLMSDVESQYRPVGGNMVPPASPTSSAESRVRPIPVNTDPAPTIQRLSRGAQLPTPPGEKTFARKIAQTIGSCSRSPR
ncbi:hypothetical protein L1987_23739 [Smallanthus sonchifolius]|uniref:Uncharacterized protein n=1 Tax=Smallanthus sonchifolius TaxID=185202 RepID=A0ACB9IJZ5_9ASTR|nr:hypothetical protein L1987_23739 [Smallanthus sonchifolius]